MDPVNPWLDPVEVRRLAERLLRPVADAASAVSDAGFDDAFIGYATPPPKEREHALRPSGEPSAVRTPPPVFQPVSETIPSTARGPFLDRVHRFRDWMRHHFAATGLFLLDREGAVIFDESNHGRLHFLARSLALASRRQGSSAGNVHVKIGAGATLEVIPVETQYGCLVLGAVVPEALPPTAVGAVMEALAQVAAPPAGK